MKLTKIEFADILGVHNASIYAIETGKAIPLEKTIQAIINLDKNIDLSMLLAARQNTAKIVESAKANQIIVRKWPAISSKETSARQFKKIRQFYNLSQRQLAEILGFSQGTINRIELGALPTDTVLLKLTKVYKAIDLAKLEAGRQNTLLKNSKKNPPVKVVIREATPKKATPQTNNNDDMQVLFQNLITGITSKKDQEIAMLTQNIEQLKQQLSVLTSENTAKEKELAGWSTLKDLIKSALEEN